MWAGDIRQNRAGFSGGELLALRAPFPVRSRFYSRAALAGRSAERGRFVVRSLFRRTFCEPPAPNLG